jgi:hypothetical protein
MLAKVNLSPTAEGDKANAPMAGLTGRRLQYHP